MEKKDIENLINSYIKNNLKIEVREKDYYSMKEIYIDLILEEESISSILILSSSKEV